MFFFKKISVAFLILLCSYCYKEPDNQILPNQYTIPATEKILVDRSNRIGFECFNYLLRNQPSEGNILVSPIGISFSLNALMSSIDSPSRQKIKLYLGVSNLVDSSINNGFKRLYKIFTEIDRNTILSDDDNFAFVNEMDLSNVFLSLIESNKNINYSVDPDAGYIPDNSNFQERTENNGFQLISKLDFKSRGKYQNRVEKLPFYYSPDKSDFIDMIVSEATYNYYGDAVLKAIEIPLGRGNFNMLIVIPKGGQSIEELALNFNSNMLRKINNKFRPQNIEAYIPKLNVSTAESYTNHLKKGSLNSCFMSKRQELRGLVKEESCFLSDFEQAINLQFSYTPNVELDNSKPKLEPGEKESFFIDRPFLFIIYEKYSEGIIFMGKIVNP